MSTEELNRAILATWDEEEDYDELDWCEMGDHEFEFVLFADGSVTEECVRCGAIDAWEA